MDHEFSKIHERWYPKDCETKCNIEFYLYPPRWAEICFIRLSALSLFFEELNLTRKESVSRNPKPDRRKKNKEHLKTLILKITETMNDFSSDLYM